VENDVELGHDENAVESEYPQSLLPRIVLFLRSVMPADPWHWVFLLGTILVFISPRLAWVPLKIINSVGVQWSRLPSEDTNGVVAQLRASLVPIVVAGLISGYLCFWAGRRQLWRLLLGVICPSALGLVLIVAEFFNWTHGARSLFGRPQAVIIYDWLRVSAKLMPTGTYICTLGLFLVTVMTVRVGLGLSSLPLSLRSTQPTSLDEEVSWHRLQLVIYFMIFLLVLFSTASDTLLYFPYAHVRNTGFALTYRFVAQAVGEALIVIVCVWVGGKQARRNALNSLRLPKAYYALFALAIPVAFALFVSLGPYLYALADWAGRGYNEFTKASFTDYFPYAGLWSWALLTHVWSAFGEEIIFRGILLPGLMKRYDFYRGIFLTGIIWAAYHFYWDTHAEFPFGRVFVVIGFRVAICVAMNYGLAWLTLRSGSIIPAGIAHTVSNMLIHAGVNNPVPWEKELRVLLWLMLALILFRYWPPEYEAEATAHAPHPITVA
jgi:uncharacterized protein